MKNKIKLYVMLLTVLFFALIGFWWIIPGILFFGGAWIIFSANVAWIVKIKKHGFLTGAITIALIFLLAICLRLFVFEIFSIPSPSICIKYYEGVDVIEKEGKIYINGEYREKYIFKNNYYFMMGDNRNDSQDSRYWGFVPEQNVVGKAVLVMFSNDGRGFNFQSVFKKL